MDIIIEESDVKEKTSAEEERDPLNKPIDDTDEIFAYVNRLISNAEKRGDEFIIITAERIHTDLNLRGDYPAVCDAMRRAIRRGDVILHEVSPDDYSTLEIKYVLRTVKKSVPAGHKNPLDVIDDIANKALSYADASFTIVRYMLCVVFGLGLIIAGINVIGACNNLPITVWNASAVWFLVLVIIGGILFVSAEIATFIYLVSLPRGTGVWFRNYASKVRYAYSLSAVGVVISAICLGCIGAGRVVSGTLLVGFIILAVTFIAQAILCGMKVKNK
jgi:hypothetical protein